MMLVGQNADSEVRCGDGKRNYLRCPSKRPFPPSFSLDCWRCPWQGVVCISRFSPQAHRGPSPFHLLPFEVVEGEEVEVTCSSCLIDPSAHGNNSFPELW